MLPMARRTTRPEVAVLNGATVISWSILDCYWPIVATKIDQLMTVAQPPPMLMTHLNETRDSFSCRAPPKTAGSLMCIYG